MLPRSNGPANNVAVPLTLSGVVCSLLAMSELTSAFSSGELIALSFLLEPEPPAHGPVPFSPSFVSPAPSLRQ